MGGKKRYQSFHIHTSQERTHYSMRTLSQKLQEPDNFCVGVFTTWFLLMIACRFLKMEGIWVLLEMVCVCASFHLRIREISRNKWSVMKRKASEYLRSHDLREEKKRLRYCSALTSDSWNLNKQFFSSLVFSPRDISYSTIFLRLAMCHSPTILVLLFLWAQTHFILLISYTVN